MGWWYLMVGVSSARSIWWWVHLLHWWAYLVLGASTVRVLLIDCQKGITLTKYTNYTVKRGLTLTKYTGSLVPQEKFV